MKRFDFSRRGRARVYLLTALGTALCIAVAFAFDSYDAATGAWRWGDRPINNVLIPLVLATPLFFYLLSKLRELAIAHHELMHVAATDTLTACLNRRAFTAIVEGWLDKVERGEARAQGALLVIDIDHFKRVNDSFGHDCGDEALKLVAGAIRGAVREVDLVGRLGGEEFSVFLPGADPGRSSAIAERIRECVQQAGFAPHGRPYTLSASVGGATFDRLATFSELYRVADQRLYAAKRAGRNRIDLTALALAPTAGNVVPLALH